MRVIFYLDDDDGFAQEKVMSLGGGGAFPLIVIYFFPCQEMKLSYFDVFHG